MWVENASVIQVLAMPQAEMALLVAFSAPLRARRHSDCYVQAPSLSLARVACFRKNIFLAVRPVSLGLLRSLLRDPDHVSQAASAMQTVSLWTEESCATQTQACGGRYKQSSAGSYSNIVAGCCKNLTCDILQALSW